MAHEVILDIATRFILHKDVEVEVRENGTKLGTLLISKGNIEWRQSGYTATKHRMSWAKFAEFMTLEGKKVVKKPPKKSVALPKQVGPDAGSLE